MFDIFYIGPKPNLFTHEQSVDSIEQAQLLSKTRYCWVINYLLDYSNFDFLWEPVPWQSEYTHTWPTQWDQFYGAYLIPKHGEIKYHYHDEVLPAKKYQENYRVLVESDFDQSWLPHPWDPPYIYVFGNQWHSAETMPTVEYHMPGATERKYMSWPRSTLKSDATNWVIPHNIDATDLDLSWVPDPGSPPYIYQFGTQHQRTGGPVYTVPGAIEIKYVSHPRALKTSVDSNWAVPDGVDTDSFDWTWHPDATDGPYIYQFGTQHQRTGGPVYTVPGATETKYVEQIKIKTDSKSAVIVEVDHLDGNAGNVPNTIKTIRYFDNYRDTLIRLAKSLVGQYEFVWVCSSICDYSGFDFSWHPEQWQATMLHVFPSNEQKFGDTFYMHVPTFAERAEKKALLEWYDVNYVNKMVVRRRLPVIEHTEDSQADAVKNSDWTGPLALFTTTGLPMTIPTVPLWRTEVKTIMPLSRGASAVIVPRIARGDIRTQLYDYPYIDKTQSKRHVDQPLDIVFISNGENEADFLYQWMVDSVGGNSSVNGSHRIKHVKNVKGRVAAYQAAARASTTPWFFAVFAKLQVDLGFDWNWQPDRMQQAKHYIFHAMNPLNGLVYGHQAMIAYNKHLVLENTGVGLDFTLDQPHEVVPILSGTANYYTSNWMCWRTAFREALKLKASLPDVENEYRLNQWLSKDSSVEQWSMKGAQDAVEFYEAVNGNPTELRKSYEWDWLASYAFVKRSLVP
jgi:hypothetical protein